LLRRDVLDDLTCCARGAVGFGGEPVDRRIVFREQCVSCHSLSRRLLIVPSFQRTSFLELMPPPLPAPRTCGPLRDDLPEFLLGLLWEVVPRSGQQEISPDFVQCEDLIEAALCV